MFVLFQGLDKFSTALFKKSSIGLDGKVGVSQRKAVKAANIFVVSVTHCSPPQLRKSLPN